MKIRPVGAELFHPERLDEGSSTFLNFPNTPNNEELSDVMGMLLII